VKDLTQGSITRHIFNMAAPIAFGMIFQTLYYLVDLYFVAHLGDVAIAGVSTASNAVFLVFALTQVLSVGTVALISQAVGRKDQPEANLIFNQSLVLSALCGLITLVGGYALTGSYMRSVGADEATALAGSTFLYWFLPGLALQFALVAMGSALRGTGIVQPTMVVQVVTVVLNIVLAPVLIAGWGTGHPMGVAGAALASTVATCFAVVMLGMYFFRLEKYVSFHREQWRPRLASWRRMLGIGLPAGGEFLLMFVYIGVIYWCIRNFGSVAQAGFGVGSRVMQAIFLPAMAVAFAAGPIAGQNFGARQSERVRETFRKTAGISVLIMGTLTLLAQWRPDLMVAGFTDDPEVREVGATFLRLQSWNFVAQAFIFTASSLFQGLGDTRPALLGTATRLITFVGPAIWLSSQPFFRIEHIWYLSIATVTLQALASWGLVTWYMRRRLASIAPAVAVAA
jgi:putative MATE family efflux protein